MRLSGAPFAAGIDRAQNNSSPPIQTSTLAGYATFVPGSSSVSTTFKVARPTCTTPNSGLAPGSFIFAGPTSSETLDGAGVLDQCSSGAVTITAALIVGSAETNLPNVVKVGDTIEADVSVASTGTTVTVKDLTSPRIFTQTLTGTDATSDVELIGTDTTTINGSAVPIGTIGATQFTSSTVGGSPIGTQSPTRVILVNGCAIELSPGSIDAATGKIFNVALPRVTITNLVPTSGSTGTNVEIDGVGFTSTSTVKFGAVSAPTVTHDSTTMLHAVVPLTAITGPVTVTNTTPPGGASTACNFAVAPAITSFSPSTGITGSTVTINGSGLKPGAQVKFGTRAATVTSSSATQLTATVPNGAVTAPITVKTPAGMATTATSFAPSLSIQSFGPASGPFGTVVTINGVGFTSTSTVKFNGVAATTVAHTSATQLRATVPSTATTGPITLTNTAAPAGTVQSATSYTVTPHTAPTVTSFAPPSGITGSQVTITGTNFSGASGVKFGTLAATPFTTVSATSIKATVPSGAVAGTISVTTAAGTGTSAANFTPTLSITSFTPTSGAAGTVVTIDGIGFNASSTVSFNGIVASSVSLVSASQLKATVPAGVSTGRISVANTTAPIGTVLSRANFG